MCVPSRCLPFPPTLGGSTYFDGVENARGWKNPGGYVKEGLSNLQVHRVSHISLDGKEANGVSTRPARNSSWHVFLTPYLCIVEMFLIYLSVQGDIFRKLNNFQRASEFSCQS